MCESSGGVLHHGQPQVPRAAQRGPERVPDELGAVPEGALPPGELRARHLKGEVVAREGLCPGTHHFVLRAGASGCVIFLQIKY